MARWYVHPNVFIRVASMWGSCLLLALAVWTLAYALLPDGIARGALPVQRLPLGQGHTLLAVLIPIFLYNLVIAGGLVAVANLFRVGATPLGLIAAAINWALYGLLLGSDSLGIPIGHKLAPSLTPLLHRSGLEELTAYALIAAATTGLFTYHQRSWLDWTTTRERRWKELRIPRPERLVLAAAIALLLTANLREAVAILGVTR